LAHELRSPLAPIANMLEIMKRAEGDGDLVKQSRQTMHIRGARAEGSVLRIIVFSGCYFLPFLCKRLETLVQVPILRRSATLLRLKVVSARSCSAIRIFPRAHLLRIRRSVSVQPSSTSRD